MTKLSITVPDRINLRTVHRDGKPVPFVVQPGDIPAAVNAKIYEVGMRVLLTNVYNGGGKAATDAERLAALDKKHDSWLRGEFNVVERGESQYTAWREVFLADCIAAGMTSKQAETAIRDKVTERLGKDAKATFANFLEATAIEYAEAGDMTRDEARMALDGYYTAEADRREKERAKAEAKIDVPKIDLAKFRKAK